MSTLRLPPLKYENRDETHSECLENCQAKSKEQCFSCSTAPSETVNTEGPSADQDAANFYGDQSMLEALDSLSDYELDALLQRTLALNNTLKEHLKDEHLSGHVSARESRACKSSNARNTVVLPPIFKKESAMSTQVTANR